MLHVLPRLVVLLHLRPYDRRVDGPRQAPPLSKKAEPARLARRRHADDEGQGHTAEQDLHFPSLTKTYGQQRKFYLKGSYSGREPFARVRPAWMRWKQSR